MRGRIPFSLVLLAIGCTVRPGGDSEMRADSATSADSTVVVALRRGECFGICPTYDLSITRNGVVRIDGLDALRSRPPWQRTIPDDTVTFLLRELERAGWLGLRDRFVPGQPGCELVATDHPSVTTTVTLGGRTKTIEHYTGCRDAPAVLHVMYARIDSVAGTARWLGSHER